MITINIDGKNYVCLEHISEIKDTFNGQLFNKYYNKKQMFKDILGKVSIDERPEGGSLIEYPISKEDGDFGQFVGKKAGYGSIEYTIEIYKLEDLDFSAIDLDSELNEGDWGSFLVKDDSGQVYFVYTMED